MAVFAVVLELIFNCFSKNHQLPCSVFLFSAPSRHIAVNISGRMFLRTGFELPPGDDGFSTYNHLSRSSRFPRRIPSHLAQTIASPITDMSMLRVGSAGSTLTVLDLFLS